VQTSLYGKATFRRLSDDGKYFYLYLVTGPVSTSLSGVVSAGPLTLAEKLCWPVERVKAALADLVRCELAEVDIDAPLIWLPVAHAEDGPANPRVAAGWARLWAALPECLLRNSIRRVIEIELPRRDEQMAREGKSEGFLRMWQAVIESVVGSIDDGPDDGIETVPEPSSDRHETVPEPSADRRETVSRRSRTTDPDPAPDPKPEPQPANRAAERRARESDPDGSAAAADADGVEQLGKAPKSGRSASEMKADVEARRKAR
jgi:hypothetical protein